MNTESASAIVELLTRLDARIELLERMLTEMKEASKEAKPFTKTPGRAMQGWDGHDRRTRMGEI